MIVYTAVLTLLQCEKIKGVLVHSYYIYGKKAKHLNCILTQSFKLTTNNSQIYFQVFRD